MLRGMSDVDHIFLTRFNIPSSGAERFVRAQDGWLEQRARLFETYCLPSMMNQTAENIRWVIYFDPQSPAWLQRRIDGWSSGGAFTPVYRTSLCSAEVISDLRATVGHPAPRLLTTNLDNDDGIALDFAERVQGAAANRRQRTALYLSNGLILSGDRLYLRSDKHNAFCSVIETWDDPGSCWADWHNMLKNTMQTESVSGPPAWLQVVHGGNVSNRVHGRLVSPEPYTHRFRGLIDSVPVPRRSQRARENFLAAPARGAKGLARSSARKAVVGLLGKQGLDRLKDAAASRHKTEVGPN